jgi:hypothetical protein
MKASGEVEPGRFGTRIPGTKAFPPCLLEPSLSHVACAIGPKLLHMSFGGVASVPWRACVRDRGWGCVMGRPGGTQRCMFTSFSYSSLNKALMIDKHVGPCCLRELRRSPQEGSDAATEG